MREQLQYSKDEIITDLYTFEGKEWMYVDGIPYIGPYHRYTTGEVYTEPNWNASLSKKLIPYQDINSLAYQYKKLKPDIQTKYKNFTQHVVALTYTDYKVGNITRYFLKRINDNVITEVSKETYDEYTKSNIDNNLYSSVKLTWYIAGKLNTIEVNGITTIGTVDKNKEELAKAEKKMPGISIKLKDLTELYATTEFITPVDINDPTRLQK